MTEERTLRDILMDFRKEMRSVDDGFYGRKRLSQSQYRDQIEEILTRYVLVILSHKRNVYIGRRY